MPYARAVQCPQQEYRAVGLVGVGDVAREIVDEPPRGPARGMRADCHDRDFRLGCADQCARRGESVHRMGPPPVGLDQGAAQPAEAACDGEGR